MVIVKEMSIRMRGWKDTIVEYEWDRKGRTQSGWWCFYILWFGAFGSHTEVVGIILFFCSCLLFFLSDHSLPLCLSPGRNWGPSVPGAQSSRHGLSRMQVMKHKKEKKKKKILKTLSHLQTLFFFLFLLLFACVIDHGEAKGPRRGPFSRLC